LTPVLHVILSEALAPSAVEGKDLLSVYRRISCSRRILRSNPYSP